MGTIEEKVILREKLEDYYSEILEKELINEIIEVGSLRFIPKGELLIDIGDELTHTPLIIHGAIKVMLEDKGGEEISLYYLKKGETCAISFVNCIHKSYSIFRGIAEKDTEGIFVPLDKLDDWLVKYRSWRHYIIDSYHFRLIELVHSIENLAFTHLEERLNKYLIEKVNIMRTNILKTTHEEIARDLCTARTVVSRLLKDLEKDGKLELRRGRIIISNAEFLLNK
jgi:CRP/FNR family transcriptional regulator